MRTLRFEGLTNYEVWRIRTGMETGKYPPLLSPWRKKTGGWESDVDRGREEVQSRSQVQYYYK